MKRIFTCTPVAFGGGPDFFARDSGLLCRGLQRIGIESRAIMPGANLPEDQADLTRTEYANLESAAWWREQSLDAVVLYAWGSPRYLKVATAIHEAGIFLILNQDNGGLISPFAGLRGWAAEQWLLHGQGRNWKSRLSWAAHLFKGLTLGLAVTDRLRARHLSQGDVIACVSPLAAQHYRKLCFRYGGEALSRRVTVVPHAVEESFFYDDRAKSRRIICVGRWADSNQKRPELLIQVADMLLAADEIVEWSIVGEPTETMRSWWQSLPTTARCRVKLHGRLGREALVEQMRAAQVFYSPSAFESFGIAAAEALCCGCSVVAARSVSMSAFDWFVSENSGSLVSPDHPKTHLQALLAELQAWQSAARNAREISNVWSAKLHADHVARLITRLTTESNREKNDDATEKWCH